MIQPLHTSHVHWVLDWVDLDEPIRAGDEVFLPTCLFILTDAVNPVVGQEVLRELDQRRVESLLARLFNERGTPDQLALPESPDWDVRSWKTFAQDMQCEVRLVRSAEKNVPHLLEMSLRAKEKMARRLVEAFQANIGSIRPEEVAHGLVETSRRLHSHSKRLASLRKALQLNPQCSPALLELGDIDYQEGNLKNALQKFEHITTCEAGNWHNREVAWWTDAATRPFLRSLYGQMLVRWQMGDFDAAGEVAERLLKLNPRDNQGVRFFIPMLHLLSDRPEDALAFFDYYEKTYAGDYEEPAFLFGWGLTCDLFDDETKALRKYRQGMLRNIYIAPLLLDLPEPRRDIWHANDRCEPQYAAEFFDSYASLWERDTSQLRLLREAYEQTLPEIAKLTELRLQMIDHQDQRFDPEHRKKWEALIAEEKKLLEKHKTEK